MATPNSAPGDVKAILGKGSEFEGKLRFEGTVRIDGKFKGEVHSEGTLIVGESANIEGDVFVNSAVISGELRGNVKSKTRVELHAPAKLFGNVETPILVVQEGVIFDGHSQMSKEGQKPADKPKAVWGPEQAIPADKDKNAAAK
ncbi:MAG TPA: polymer-forming cytoskeletal protein [bacterium]|nr:polymer-forming cytoskeletal protein [bacterium]